ncbi:MAG: putative Fe-S protein YdhL (DUF1289 family) [Pseudohongiellaceae bacterium]
MSENILETVKTPCIGVCSTGIGDAVCRGCKRFAHEVINWNSYNPGQKQLIDVRLTNFLVQIVESKLTVVDEAKLQWHLKTQQISYSLHKPAATWAYELLRAGASQIQNVETYGLKLDAQYRDDSLVELRKAIDNDFFILSQAHYERYFDLAVLPIMGV